MTREAFEKRATELFNSHSYCWFLNAFHTAESEKTRFFVHNMAAFKDSRDFAMFQTAFNQYLYSIEIFVEAQ